MLRRMCTLLSTKPKPDLTCTCRSSPFGRTRTRADIPTWPLCSSSWDIETPTTVWDITVVRDRRGEPRGASARATIGLTIVYAVLSIRCCRKQQHQEVGPPVHAAVSEMSMRTKSLILSDAFIVLVYAGWNGWNDRGPRGDRSLISGPVRDRLARHAIVTN